MEIKGDYYICIVGKNPLPNYISALSYCNSNTKIFLVYTDEKVSNLISTKVVAQNIQHKLKEKFKYIDLKSCSKNDYLQIDKTMKEIFNSIFRDINKLGNTCEEEINIILDYTGGTKIMSAIFYDYFEEDIKDNDKYISNNMYLYASYISNKSNKMKLYLEPIGDDSKKQCCTDIGDIKCTCKDILDLHGYYIEGDILGNDLESEIINIRNISRKGNHKHSGKKNSYNLEKLKIENFNLLCQFKFEPKSDNVVKDLVHEYFLLKDIAEKLGGSEVKININLYSLNKKIDIKKVSNDFYKRIENKCSINLRKNVKLLIGGQ